MKPQESDSTARFVKKSLAQSAVEVDCSTWDAQAVEGRGRQGVS